MTRDEARVQRTLAYCAGLEAGLLLARADDAATDEEELIGDRLLAAWWDRFLRGYAAGRRLSADAELITISEAAAAAGVSVKRVSQAVDDGRLHAVDTDVPNPRHGGRRVLKSEVERRWRS